MDIPSGGLKRYLGFGGIDLSRTNTTSLPASHHMLAVYLVAISRQSVIYAAPDQVEKVEAS